MSNKREQEQIHQVRNKFLLLINSTLFQFIFQGALQFEDIDNLKTSLQLTNSNTPDLSSGQDDFNLFDQLEPGVPSFQAHFSVPPATTKSNDNQRGKRKRLFFLYLFFNQSIQLVIIIFISSMVCIISISVHSCKF